MTREEMQNVIGNAYGMEHTATIWFFELCEEYESSEWNDKCLFGIFSSLLDLRQYSAEME